MATPSAKVRKPKQEAIRVAILGGGCAAMAAAFELTRPEHQGRFQVTVHQMGWRLGGKGASGRGPGNRIEEHGLHLWMGFYENAFRLIRECYAELDRDPRTCRIATWTDAFQSSPFTFVADRAPGGAWDLWKVLFPPGDGLPGDPGDPGNLGDPGDTAARAGGRWSVRDYLVRCVSLLRAMIESLPTTGSTSASSGSGTAGPPGPPASPSDSESVPSRVARLLRYGGLATVGAVVEGLGLLELILGTFGPRSGRGSSPEGPLLELVQAMTKAFRAQLEALTSSRAELRRLWEIADLVLAVIRGSLRFGLLTHPRGFEAIDEYDCREWLQINGASAASVSSAFVRALYDLAFAYEDGDVTRPRIAAGQALRGAVRAFFTYRGAFFWKMRAGMGDVVFAPFYEVLERRGVKFEFFHRVENLHPGRGPNHGEDSRHVAAIDIDVQANVRSTVRDGGGYRPLVDVRGLPCWPAQPDFDQLEEGDRLRREGWDLESPWDRRCVAKTTLRRGVDFDLVVLALGGGAVPEVSRELAAADARWRDMVTFLKTVPTQAFQIWLRSDMRELGWRHPGGNVSAFVEPFDTWADMSHLTAEEDHRGTVQAIAYFCSVLPDRVGAQDCHYAAERAGEVKENAIRFLDRDIHHLWPKASAANGRFRWELLAGPERAQGKDDATGPERFDSQYWRANVTPSDRYSLSLPGTLRHRLSPLEPGYDNLTVAGDWTDCGFNEGCVEAAVMSGRLAAHALSQSPPLEDIVGYDHP